jgi:hypothetical protein
MKSSFKLIPNTKYQNFPKLMISRKLLDESDSDRLIVLFTAENVGVVVYSGNYPDYPVGHQSTTWMTLCFEDFDGEVSLKNST